MIGRRLDKYGGGHLNCPTTSRGHKVGRKKGGRRGRGSHGVRKRAKMSEFQLQQQTHSCIQLAIFLLVTCSLSEFFCLAANKSTNLLDEQLAIVDTLDDNAIRGCPKMIIILTSCLNRKRINLTNELRKFRLEVTHLNSRPRPLISSNTRRV
jgi:hypothetical protein